MIEDLEVVGERVKEVCEEFLRVVLGNVFGSGLVKGGRLEDLLGKGKGGNLMFVGVGSGMGRVVSELSKSLSGGNGGRGVGNVKRGWDWRVGEGIGRNMVGKEIMRRLRLGLVKDVVGLWLVGVDEVEW